MSAKQVFFLFLYLIAVSLLLMYVTILVQHFLLGDKYWHFSYVFLASITAVFGLIPIIIYAKRRFRIGIKSQFASFNYKLFAILLIVGLILFVSIVPFNSPVKFVKTLTNGSILWYEFGTISFEDLRWLNMILSILFYPIIEEVLFRGIILKSLMKSQSIKKALFVSSVFFAIYHLNPERILSLTVAGLFYGYVYIITNSLTVPVLLHTWNNLLSVSVQHGYFDLTSRSIVNYSLLTCIGFICIYVLMKYVALNYPVNKEFLKYE